MFKFRIGSCSLESYIPDKGFKLTAEPVGGSEEFECHDGTIIGGGSGKIIRLNVKLERVPYAVAEAVSAITSSSDFDVFFNYPYELSGKFACESYQATGKSKGQLWDISLTLKSKAAIGGDGL